MKRIHIAIIFTAGLLTAASIPVLALLPTGQQAPNFSLPDYYYMSYYTLTDYRGKVVVIDFFGIYCGYCKEDSKNLASLYNTYYRGDSRVQFFGIESTYPTGKNDVDYRTSVYNYAQAAGISSYPLLIGGSGIYNSYQCSVTPTVYVLAKDGNVAQAFAYPIDMASVKATIDRLLGSTPTPPPTASLSITKVGLWPAAPRYLTWEVTYTGSGYAAVAPAAALFAKTTSSPGYHYEGIAPAQYVYDVTTKTLSKTAIRDGHGWAPLTSGHKYWFFSGPVVPSDAKWAIYNAHAYYDGTYHPSLYTTSPYTTLR